MTTYHFWKTSDPEGEAAQAFAEAASEAIADGWADLGYRARAEMIRDADSRYRGQFGYARKTWIREFIGERLS